jgi:outer membrane protein OmpA-like peptidoglycan-associated protein
MAINSDSTGLASSFTDLMTSLAVIFILLLVASHNNEQQKLDAALVNTKVTRQQLEDAQRRLAEAEQATRTTRYQILVALQEAMQVFTAQGVRTDMDPRDPLGLLIIVPEGLLAFAINEARIPPVGLDFLRYFAPTLAQTACSPRFRDEINSIVVEGHTDSSGPDELNLPLSQARSMAVVRESLRLLRGTAEENRPSASTRSCFLHFVSVTGRGSSELICPKDREHCLRGEEDKERSRRVVFKIRVRSLEQRHIITLTQPANGSANQ